MQSHWFSVGPLVPWARPGVGAIATQAIVEISYGPRGLELLAGGASAHDALAKLRSADPGQSMRQVAIVDAEGRVATHTGNLCIPFAGHVTAAGISCQGNMLASERVWPAMLEAFQASTSPLASRLLEALDAAERAGGDARGRQSAALLVVPAEGEAWEAQVSLRVEDHPAPLVELRRLLQLHDAYALASEADGLAGEGRHGEAAERYLQATELAPGNQELRFWAALGLAQGDLEAGVKAVRGVVEAAPQWGRLLVRLPAEMAPLAAEVARRLGIAPDPAGSRRAGPEATRDRSGPRG